LLSRFAQFAQRQRRMQRHGSFMLRREQAEPFGQSLSVSHGVLIDARGAYGADAGANGRRLGPGLIKAVELRLLLTQSSVQS
jgi:hypothetical protein